MVSLGRGAVFGASHDASYDFWVSGEPKWKMCLAFNVNPPAANDDVHYFIATSNVGFFRENPHLLSDVLILPARAYPFFPEETVLDFRDLCVVPLAKLQAKGLKLLGKLNESDVTRCENTIRSARILGNREKRRLALLS